MLLPTATRLLTKNVLVSLTFGVFTKGILYGGPKGTSNIYIYVNIHDFCLNCKYLREYMRIGAKAINIYINIHVSICV